LRKKEPTPAALKEKKRLDFTLKKAAAPTRWQSRGRKNLDTMPLRNSRRNAIEEEKKKGQKPMMSTQSVPSRRKGREGGKKVRELENSH